MTKTLAMLAFLMALPATAALAGETCDVPPAQRQSLEALTKLTGDFGWTIDKMKIDDGCYELRVTDASRNVLKVKLDPATLEVIDGKVKRFGDDGKASPGAKSHEVAPRDGVAD